MKKDKKEEEPIQPSFPWRNQYFNRLKDKFLSIGRSRIFFQEIVKKFDVMQFMNSDRIVKLGNLYLIYISNK
jgi:hypothetical protein